MAYAVTVPVPAAGAVHRAVVDVRRAFVTCVRPPAHAVILRLLASDTAMVPTFAALKLVGVVAPEKTAHAQPRNPCAERDRSSETKGKSLGRLAHEVGWPCVASTGSCCQHLRALNPPPIERSELLSSCGNRLTAAPCIVMV